MIVICTEQQSKLTILHQQGIVTVLRRHCSKGYKHLFVNTVCGLERTGNIDMSNKNFYKLEDDSFYQWAKTNHPDAQRKFNHFDTATHAAYADILHQYILKTL